MKTEITPKEYINIYHACNWDSKAFSIVLKRLGYSDVLIVDGNLDLMNSPIKSLVNVTVVGGYLDLRWTPLEDLGKLKEVVSGLDLGHIPIQDLGNLQKIGGGLWLNKTPLSEKYSEAEIRRLINVKGAIFL